MARPAHELQLRVLGGQRHQRGLGLRVDRHQPLGRRPGRPRHQHPRHVAGIGSDLHQRPRGGRVKTGKQQLAQVAQRMAPPPRIGGHRVVIELERRHGTGECSRRAQRRAGSVRGVSEPANRPTGPASLFARLDVQLPSELAVGAGTALFVCGWCFAPEAGIRALSLDLDGIRHPVMAFGMPRLDPFAELHPGLDPYATAALAQDAASAEDPELRSYRSGFWGLVPVGPAPAGHRLELELEADLDDGSAARTPLGAITVVALQAPAAADAPGGAGPLVAICMATYNPPLDLLERQLDSIRAQTHRRWVCLISDDCSEARALRGAATAAAGDDPASSSPARRGGWASTATSSGRSRWCRPTADYVALADQDDRWHPDKLAALLGGDRRRAARLQRRPHGRPRRAPSISDTYWSARRHNHADLLSLLVANSVSGAASLLRRDLLDDALPVPPAPVRPLPRSLARRWSRGHWARSRFVDRPLYDYVQHGHAALGHAAANQMTDAARRGCAAARPARAGAHVAPALLRRCRAACCSASPILRLRCGERITPASRRALERFAGADDSLARAGALGYRGALELAGRRETLGAEWMLFSRVQLAAAAGCDRPRPAQRRLRLDAVPPPDLAPRPGRQDTTGPGGPCGGADKIAPLDAGAVAAAPARINLLVPTIDLEHFFGGYIAKFNLARRLAEAGLRVRVVTVDPVGPLPRAWRRTIEAYSGLDGLFDGLRSHSAASRRRSRSTLTTGSSPPPGGRPTSRRRRALAPAGARGAAFLYLIQEYEPFTFPMGTYAALAAASPTPLPHFAPVLERAPARLFPPSPHRRVRRGPRRRRALGVVSERDHRRRRRRPSPSWPAADPGGCCSTPVPSPTPRATCSSSGCWR